MDWSSVIIDALSVTSIIAIIQAIRFWKQNKQLKNNEVKKDDVETQKAEIDLANLYKEEMLKVIELLKSSQTESKVNQKEMINKLNRLDTGLEQVEIKMNNIETYLNGPYHQWLASKEVKPAKNQKSLNNSLK